MDGGSQLPRVGKVAAAAAQVASRRHRGVHDVVRVALGRYAHPCARDELHRSNRPVPHRVAVESSPVGVRDSSVAAGAVQHRTENRRQDSARRGDAGTVAAVVGLHLADTREHRPAEQTSRVGHGQLRHGALVGAQDDGRYAGARESGQSGRV